MTTHQDNAARLAGIAQITAVVVLALAVAAFIFQIPEEKIETKTANRANPNAGDQASGATSRFHVTKKDWLTAIALEKVSGVTPNSDGAVATTKNPGETTPENDLGGPDTRDPRQAQRPPIRYLGHIDDSNGFAALIEFAGRQRLLRTEEVFEDDFEILEITEDAITVTDGFEEFTFKLAPSTLAEAVPAPGIKPPVVNPNAFPRGAQPGLRPGDRENPRRPGPQNDDDGGSPA